MDRILIPLKSTTNLSDLVQKWREDGTNATNLISRGAILDSEGVYQNWLNHKVSMTNWNEVHRDPVLNAMRVVRTYIRAGYEELPEAVFAKLKAELSSANQTDIFFGVRFLGRVLSDSNAELQLNIYKKLELYKRLSPSFHEYLSQLDSQTTKSLLARVSERRSSGHSNSVDLVLVFMKEAPPQSLRDFARGFVPSPSEDAYTCTSLSSTTIKLISAP